MKTKTMLSTLALLAAVPAMAGEGRIPIYQATTIMAPGHYVLTRDIAGAAGGGPVIGIQADGVTLSLNGHTIMGQPSDPCIQFSGQAGTSGGVTITGGTLMGCQDGIHVTNAERRHVVLSDLTIVGVADAGVQVDNAGSVEIRRLQIRGATVGIQATGPGAASGISPCIRVADSMVQAQTGISCTAVTCDLQNNILSIASRAISIINSKGSNASGNKTINCPVCFNPQPEPPARQVEVVGSPGVRIFGNGIYGDPTANGSNHGISVDAMSPGAMVADNTLEGLGDSGIQVLASDSWILGNLVRDNGAGIVVGGSNNLIGGNKVAGNDGDGINLTGTHVYRNNVLLGNGAPLGGPGAADVVDGGGNVQ